MAESKKQSKIIKYPLVRIRGSHILIHSFEKIRENVVGQNISNYFQKNRKIA